MDNYVNMDDGCRRGLLHADLTDLQSVFSGLCS